MFSCGMQQNPEMKEGPCSSSKELEEQTFRPTFLRPSYSSGDSPYSYNLSKRMPADMPRRKRLALKGHIAADHRSPDILKKHTG